MFVFYFSTLFILKIYQHPNEIVQDLFNQKYSFLLKSVSNVWYELWRCVYSCLIVTFWKYDYSLIWTLKKCVVLFGSLSDCNRTPTHNHLFHICKWRLNHFAKLSILFDMKSEVLTIVGSNCLKVWIFFIFLVKCFFFGQIFLLLYVLGSHACIF